MNNKKVVKLSRTEEERIEEAVQEIGTRLLFIPDASENNRKIIIIGVCKSWEVNKSDVLKKIRERLPKENEEGKAFRYTSSFRWALEAFALL